MKTRAAFLLVGFLAIAGLATAQEAAPVAKPAAADQAFAEFTSLRDAQNRFMRDERWRTVTPAERLRVTSAGAEFECALGERFLADYPADVRRWDVIAAMFPAQRGFDGADADARRAAWEKRCGEFRAMIMAATDAPSSAIEIVMYLDTIRAARGKAMDLARAGQDAEFLASHSPAAKNRGVVEKLYVEALATSDEAAARRRVQQLANDSNPLVADMAKLKLGAMALASDAVELKFPDLDGHEVDLAKYRGKVVLLDFWATWCVPCMEEMPNLKAVYAKYHAQGFEIIGITDDIPAKDPEHPKGNEKTVATLKAALEKQAMPWPQLWDTRLQDPPTVKRLLRQFDVGSLPTGILIDKNGHVYTKDTRSDKLEANVRKLLGLDH